MSFIESVFHNHYIPPIVLSVVYDASTGMNIQMCIDGKQRLTSLARFLGGHIASRGTRKEIPHEWKTIFTEKFITVIEYTQLPQRNEHNIFQRMNTP
ncbi:hypothetical protein OF83DRAFT_1175897 [Amylostereum chailletii]|nr:hypothetical protein OF83DRAFT_1175897 [Amylostereum chailletii]